MAARAHLSAGLASLVLASAPHAPELATGAGSGSFSPTASPTTPRKAPAAAKLGDGRVLVAGGGTSTSYLASAEVFSPSTPTFSPTGSMMIAREDAAAAPLSGGGVLVAGGLSGPYLQSAEAFDPVTGGFSLIADMGARRDLPGAAPLPDGRILVAGGYDGGGFLASAETYDPQTNSWSPVSDMTIPRWGPAVAPLADGRVLVAGGQTEGGGILNSAELFDPKTNTFSSAGVGALIAQRCCAAAAPLPDGRVLIAGGLIVADGRTQPLQSAEVFNPQTNTFSSAGIGSLGGPREFGAAAPLGDGRVLVAGGDNGQEILRTAEIFAATNTFRFRVKGRRLVVRVQASGRVSVSDVASPLAASPSRKKARLFLKRSSGADDPPTITVPLRLSKLAKQRLRRQGEVAVKARLRFAPQGGLPNSRTAKLKIKHRGQ